MPLYRVTEYDNPSNRSVVEADRVSVVDGCWVLVATERTTGGPSIADLATSDYSVEVEEHGGTWHVVDPDDPGAVYAPEVG